MQSFLVCMKISQRLWFSHRKECDASFDLGGLKPETSAIPGTSHWTRN